MMAYFQLLSPLSAEATHPQTPTILHTMTRFEQASLSHLDKGPHDIVEPASHLFELPATGVLQSPAADDVVAAVI
jgi:hypothetical protein